MDLWIGFIITTVFKLICMLSCMLILRQRKTGIDFQLTKHLRITIVLDLEDKTEKLYGTNFEKSTTFLEQPSYSPTLRNGPWYRGSRSFPGRDRPKGDGKALYPCSEQHETSEDHTSWSCVCTPRKIHKSMPRVTKQVLQNFCINFQRIGPYSCLPRSRYTTS